MPPPIQSFILRILQAEDKVHFSSTSAALRGFQPHYPPIHPFLQHSFVHVFVRQQCSYEAQHKSHVFTLSNAGHIATRSKPKFRFQESFLGSSLYQRRPKLCLRNAFMPHDQSLITPPPPLGGGFFSYSDSCTLAVTADIGTELKTRASLPLETFVTFLLLWPHFCFTLK